MFKRIFCKLNIYSYVITYMYDVAIFYVVKINMQDCGYLFGLQFCFVLLCWHHNICFKMSCYYNSLKYQTVLPKLKPLYSKMFHTYILWLQYIFAFHLCKKSLCYLSTHNVNIKMQMTPYMNSLQWMVLGLSLFNVFPHFYHM